jgi:hypothetical protein
MSENTTLQIDRIRSFKLDKITDYQGIPKNMGCNDFIDKAYEAIKPLVPKILETGEFLELEIDVTAKIASDMVFGSMSVPFDPSSEQEKLIEEQKEVLINEQFKALDKKKEARKARFQTTN